MGNVPLQVLKELETKRGRISLPSTLQLPLQRLRPLVTLLWRSISTVLRLKGLEARFRRVLTIYRRLKQRLGCSLRASLYKGSVVRQGKKATHKCSRTESSFSGSSKVQVQCQKQTVLVTTDNLPEVYIKKQGAIHMMDMCALL